MKTSIATTGILLLAGQLAIGCGHPFALSKLRTRAAFEFECPENRLKLTELGSYKTQGVEGCGKRGVYVLLGNGTWALNSEALNSEAESTESGWRRPRPR